MSPTADRPDVANLERAMDALTRSIEVRQAKGEWRDGQSIAVTYRYW